MKNSLFWNERPSKRLKLIENALKMDPFLYHKKKNVISSGFNDSNEKDGENTNTELLFCQDENNKQINLYKNYINSKSSNIEANTGNYLKYMMKQKKSSHKTIPIATEPNVPIENIYDNSIINKKHVKKYSYQESYTPNKYFLNNNNNLNISNYRIDSRGTKNNKNNNILNYNNYGDNNIYNLKYLLPNKNNNPFTNINEVSYEDINNDNIRNSNYLPKIQSLKGTTDITNHNYYDKISKQLILQMNKNYQNYNKDLVNKRYSPNVGKKIFNLKNDNLSLPPGTISNPRYYNLGESRLRSNPIVNPGNRAPIFNNLNYHNHKLKSEFI